MDFQKSSLSSSLVLTRSPATRHFFRQAITNLKNTMCIFVDSEEEALSQLKNILPSWIFLDDQIENCDPFVFCKTIRNLPDHHYTPILVISSQLKKGFMRRFLKAGATDFLRHPLEEEDFLHRLEIAKKISRTEKKIGELKAQFNTLKKDPILLSSKVFLDSQVMQLLKEQINTHPSFSLFALEIDQFAPLSLEEKQQIETPLLQETKKNLLYLIGEKGHVFSQGEGRFLLFLPVSSLKEATIKGHSIKHFFHKLSFRRGKRTLTLTISMGIAFLHKASHKKDPTFYINYLLRQAQICLDEAKKIGDTLLSTQNPFENGEDG